jgi:hypothetical protein
MQTSDVRQALTRLMTTQIRSLPVYLTYTSPWTPRGDEKALATSRLIAADQSEMANRIAEAQLERFGTVDTGNYPIDFYDTHDLSVDYLVQKMIRNQHRDIAVIEECVEALRTDVEAQSLAREALGAARGHLESLEELSRQPSAATS